MRLEYMGLSALSGSLIALEGVSGAAYDETAEITLPDGTRRTGRVIRLGGTRPSSRSSRAPAASPRTTPAPTSPGSP